MAGDFPINRGSPRLSLEELPEVAVFFGQGPDLQGAAHGGQEGFFLKGLGQVVKGPLLDQLHGRGDGPEGGQGDKRDLRRNGVSVPQEVETAERLHEQIGKNQVEGLFVQQAGRFFSLRCRHNFILFGRNIRLRSDNTGFRHPRPGDGASKDSFRTGKPNISPGEKQGDRVPSPSRGFYPDRTPVGLHYFLR